MARGRKPGTVIGTLLSFYFHLLFFSCYSFFFLLRYKFIPWNAGGASPKKVSVAYHATDTLDN